MSFLKKIYEVSKLGKDSNQFVKKEAEKLNIFIKIGYDLENNESTVIVDEELLKFLDSKNISYSDFLKEEFIDIDMNTHLDLYLSEEKFIDGKLSCYITDFCINEVKINEKVELSYLIDFNTIIKR